MLLGWKNKFQHALQEADKERKLALAAHAQIEDLNTKLEPYMSNMAIFREPSM